MSKFKVGDRVRLVKTNGCERWGKEGEEGTVLIEDDGCDDCRVAFDASGEWYASWSDLEHVVAVAPATAKLKIEAGKFYKTRDGRKVGPMYPSGKDRWPWAAGEGGSDNLWRSNGNWYPTGVADVSDLVAEWVDEPATPAPTELAVKLGLEFVPFPQVGDAVLIPGVISAINQSPRGTNYNIVFETQNRRMSLHFLEEDFILDEDDGDGGCVCANNDNGPVPTGDTAKAFDALANSIFGLTVRRAA